MSTPVILVVEDNVSARKMLEAALERAGYTVHCAPDGEAALRLMADVKPVLIVQDLVLPDMDGFELAHKLRVAPGGAEVPIVACSGFLAEGERARIAAAGFDDFLVKPVDLAQLVDTVRRFVPLEREGRPPRGKLVLVVDDDPVQRKLLSVHLERAGFEVAACESGEEALKRAGERPPDAVASDIIMPGLNGFGLCLALRRDPELEKVPIVLFSANYLEPQDCQVARNVGANAFVVRTPSFSEVVDALEGCLLTKTRPEPARYVETRSPTNRMLQHFDRQSSLNSRLIQDATKTATGLSILGAVSDALARSDDLDVALGDAVACCLEAGGISAGAVFVLDADGYPVLRAASGLEGEARRHVESLLATQGFVERVLASEVPVPLPLGLRQVEREVLDRAGFSSAIIAPLSLRGEKLGMLVLAARERDLSSADWLAFARPVAAQLALSLALARSFERVQTSERRYRGLMEQANDAVFVLDERGFVVEMNRQAERLLGRASAELLGTRLEVLAEAANRSARVTELELEGARGSRVHVDVSASRVELGARSLVVAIARDVSERREAREEQARLYREANRARRARDEFLLAASQELEAPLARLASALDLAADHTSVAAALAPARRHVEHLSVLVELMTFAAQDGRELALEPEEVELGELVHAVAERFGPALEEAGCALTFTCSSPVSGRWDPVRLEQAVTVLFAAALRHGAGKPVGVAIEAEPGRARLTIGDGGSGIATPSPEKSLESERPGLGLAIARRIIEASRGTLSVIRWPGKGATISVTLPL